MHGKLCEYSGLFFSGSFFSHSSSVSDTSSASEDFADTRVRVFLRIGEEEEEEEKEAKLRHLCVIEAFELEM